MSYSEIIVISIAAVGSAIIKNGVGVGAGIFLLPVLALVLPPKVALGLGAPAMLISDIVGVKNYWGEWDKKELMILLPLAAIGVLLGCYLIKITPDTLFKQCVGIFALLFSSVHIVKMIRNIHINRKITKRPVIEKSDRSNLSTMLFGFLGGVASAVAHAGGLMLSVYMIQNRANPRVFVGTLVLFFAIINLFKLFAYLNIGIITTKTLVLVAAVSPVIVLGGYIGNMLNKKIPHELFKLIILVLIFMIGFRLQWTA